jgi:serine/threonine protein kinase
MESLTAAEPRMVGEFRLRARLGAGGMGRVFLASSMAGRMVAVKVIHPELAGDPDFVRRFRAEVDAAQRVSGLYTAPVVAAGVDEVPPWLATAFVPGPSLEDVVARYGPLPTPALWRLAGGLAEALRAIHGAGLVHRDLKPANVLLASDGPRVIDFGIARAASDTRLTATGAIIGTPSYMSPEQVEGLVCGPPSDVFSLGSVLAFAATGTPPFAGGPGGSSASVMYRIVHGEPDLRAVGGPVLDLIAACLAKDRARRPDLGQVAVHCATAAEYLGLSASAFWPPDVSQVIAARQADLAGQLRRLEVAAVPPGAEPWPAPTGTSSRLAAPVPTGPSMLGQASAPPRAPLATTPGRLSSPGTSRRGVLIGGGAAGIAVVGGLAGWALSRQSPRSASLGYRQTSPPGSPAGPGTGTGGPEGSRQLAWTFTTGNAVEANPGAGNGVVYVGSRDNYLYAVDIAGSPRPPSGWATWSARPAPPEDSPPSTPPPGSSPGSSRPASRRCSSSPGR